ncbi:MAG: sugar phosphate isomerase/epimerase [Planctomycetales bacterium]|nr:sugar phosphate isomerase/epimerase [Planctomycetales bacterium]
MKYCMNLLLWTGGVTENDLPVIEQLKEMGYDGVELPLFEAGDAGRYQQLGKQLDDLGLGRTAVTVLNADANPISPDSSVRRQGVETIKAVLDTCAAAGVETLVGPFHSAIGEFSGAGPTEEEWKWGVECMREMAEHAGKVGVRLGVEPLNRFETYLLNTQADAARFAREVEHPSCGMLYDTFHANIEEKDIAAAIEACADKIYHVHISENDRSTPGAGAVDWNTNFDTLHKVGYDGWMTVEAFGRSLPEIVAATKIWRKMYESEMQLAKDALSFMRAEVAKRWG